MLKTQITREEIDKLDLIKFDGDIILIDGPSDLTEISSFLKKQPLLGFDTETKPSFKKGNNHKVALLQLSTKETAFLFRLHNTGLPKEIATVLSDKNIIKAGVAIRDDIKSLKKLRPFEPAGFVELQEYAKKFGIENFSLKKLAGIVLNIRVSKRQQLSNWENGELTEAQIRYAATDAWACYRIYKELSGRIPDKDSVSESC